MSKLFFVLIPLKRILYFIKKILSTIQNGIKWLSSSNEHTNFSFYLTERQIKHLSFILANFFTINEELVIEKFNKLQQINFEDRKNKEKTKTIDLDFSPKWDYRMIPYILLTETKVKNIIEFGVDQGRTGYLVSNLISEYKIDDINYIGIEYNPRKGVLIEDKLSNQINLIYSKLEDELQNLEKSYLENSILVSSTHEFNSEKYLFDYLTENKIFPKIIISDETSNKSPYVEFVKNNIYDEIIFPIEDPNNFLDTMYIGIAKLPNK